MNDTEPQTTGGKVHWHFTMSLDGFVAGPNHTMDWMTGMSARPGLEDEYIKTTGAVLGGRDGWDVDNDCTHPAILGFGRPLFDDYDVPIELDLLEQRSFEQGVTMHRYAIRDAKEASSC
ncbi:hypothetical protein ACFLIM_44875 [Nonomuraea sp. M3C6]|uniref:RibD C-terminal domain-containing protein n=1 Tax=Nonomuraea marmarensis TaxID=3351344 RepID=A0ABW7ASF0_9ACTN